MAIEGLKPTVVEQITSSADSVGVTVKALEMLDLVEDRERVQESVENDFAALDEAGVVGEKFVKLTSHSITLPEFIAVLEQGEFSGRQYPGTFYDSEVWTPSLAGAYSQPVRPHARLALHNPENSDEPLLHFLGVPFDGMYAKKRQQTQLNLITEAKGRYENEHAGFNMLALDHLDIAFIALTRRIKGQAMPIEWGFMRDATLPRVTAGGDSYVGDVDSDGGRLRFGGSNGGADPDGGVGLSVGQKLETQTS